MSRVPRHVENNLHICFSNHKMDLCQRSKGKSIPFKGKAKDALKKANGANSGELQLKNRGVTWNTLEKHVRKAYRTNKNP